MKSTLFSGFDVTAEDNSEFRKDFANLMAVTKKQRAIVLKAAPLIRGAVTRDSLERSMKDVAEKAGLTLVNVSSINDIIMFFLDRLAAQDYDEQNDSPEFWGEDLVSLGLLDIDRMDKFIDFIKSAAQFGKDKYNTLVSQLRTTAGVLPTLKATGTTAELRGVFEKKWETGSPVEDYNPVVTSVVPVISLRITVEGGETSIFVCQANPSELQVFVDQLKAAIKQAESLKNACTIRSQAT